MFYNTFRTTKSSIREAEKNKLAGVGQTIVGHRERLLNLQKREKIKDLLITKFMQKYGIKNPEIILEDEITKFLQGEKLTDADLRKLDIKIKKLLKEKQTKDNLTNKLAQSLPEIPNTNSGLTLINKKTNLNTENNLLDENTISKRGKSQPKILSTEPGINTLLQPKLSTSLYSPKNVYRRIYKSPEQELAELEAEFGGEEKNNKKNNRYERLDFSKEGDEWSAIAKYNRKLYEDQIKKQQLKDSQLKKRNREDLQDQIRQRLKREYEDNLKEKEYDNILIENQKKMDELEKQKLELIKQQKMREKESRDAQMKENYIRKRIETLKDQKYERGLVKTIKESLENEKKETIEKKRRENEALLKAIKDNEIKIKNKLEKEKKEKEEEAKMAEERILMDKKEDLAREKYYESIKKYGNKYSLKNADEVINKIKKEQDEEDKRIQFYYDEKNKLLIENEQKEEIRRQKDKKELKKYLDMQIEEKKKEEEFLKSLDDEQARIWRIDSQKYHADQQSIENTIRAMNKRNLALLKEQMEQKKNQNNPNTMTDAEYAMNRDILEKAKTSLA